MTLKGFGPSLLPELMSEKSPYNLVISAIIKMHLENSHFKLRLQYANGTDRKLESLLQPSSETQLAFDAYNIDDDDDRRDTAALGIMNEICQVLAQLRGLC